MSVFGLIPIGQIASPWLYYQLPLVTLMILATVGFSVSQIGSSDSRGRTAELAQAILIAAYFSLALGLLTQQLLHTRWVVWGIFQINDASDFLHSAITYLHEGSFITPRGRVINNLLYAGLLDVTAFNLRTSLWIVSAITAISAISLTGALTRCMGVSVGLVSTLVLLEFAYEHIGGTTTELPGLAFGLSATALLVYGARSGLWSAVLVGYTILCVAMVTRIGAALVLPGILIWSTYFLPPLFGRKWMAGVACLIITVFVIIGNSALTKQVSPQSGGTFVNAVDSWYAIIVEGQLLLNQRTEASVIPVTRWVQIYRDYPDILELPMSQRPQRKREIFFTSLLAAPEAAVIGSMREIVEYIGQFKMYRFVEAKPLRFLLTALTLIGAGYSLTIARRRRDPICGLLSITGIAILLSQPFLYGGESRVPAPTVGLLAALAGLGWAVCSNALCKRFRKNDDQIAPRGHRKGDIYAWSATGPTLALAAAVVMGLFAGGTWHSTSPTSTKTSTCNTETEPTVLMMNAGSSIAIGGANGHSLEDLRSRGAWLEEYLRVSLDSYLPFLLPAQSAEQPAMIGYGVDLIQGRLLSPVVSKPLVKKTVSILCTSKVGPIWWTTDIE